MSPPSRNPPRGSNDDARTDRRDARTVLEVRPRAEADASARPGEKRTIFGFALPTPGFARAPEQAYEATQEAPRPPSSGVMVGRVAGIGQAAPAPPPAGDAALAPTTFHVRGHDARPAKGLTVTDPQYVIPARAHTVLKEEPSEARVAPVHRAQPAAFHGAPHHAPPIATARLAHTPVPARERLLAETHELPRVAHGEPPSTLEMEDLYEPARAASAPAVDAPLVRSPGVSQGALEAPDVRTAFVDVRALAAAQQMALPAQRGVTGDDDEREHGGVWQEPSGSRPEPPSFRGPPSSRAAQERGRQGEHEGVDLDRVLGRAPRRTLLLGGVSALVVLLAALSFLLRSSPPAQAPLRAAAATATRSARAGEAVSAPPAPRAAPQEAAPAAAATSLPEGQSEPDSPQPAARANHVSATPERAAILYIEGKYKQALAEYRLLAAAYPSQKVYAELARILKRKIVDTCLRTQPNRREQCKAL